MAAMGAGARRDGGNVGLEYTARKYDGGFGGHWELCV